MSLAVGSFLYAMIGVGVWIGLNNRKQPQLVSTLVALIWPAFAAARLGLWIGEQ